MSEKRKRMNDEEFMKNYDRHNKSDSRSNRYIKGKEERSLKGLGYMIFLIVVFIAAYFIFSKLIFPPQI